MIYIKSKYPDDMIRELNQYGISSTDCSVSANPQIYKLINLDGSKVSNLILNPEMSYIFEKDVSGIFKLVCINPSLEMIEQCENTPKSFQVETSKTNGSILFFIFLLFIAVLSYIMEWHKI